MFKKLISEVAFETMDKFAANFKRVSSSSNFGMNFTNLDDLDSQSSFDLPFKGDDEY